MVRRRPEPMDEPIPRGTTVRVTATGQVGTLTGYFADRAWVRFPEDGPREGPHPYRVEELSR